MPIRVALAFLAVLVLMTAALLAGAGATPRSQHSALTDHCIHKGPVTICIPT
jgi:hypothetical protein